MNLCSSTLTWWAHFNGMSYWLELGLCWAPAVCLDCFFFGQVVLLAQFLVTVMRVYGLDGSVFLVSFGVHVLQSFSARSSWIGLYMVGLCFDGVNRWHRLSTRCFGADISWSVRWCLPLQTLSDQVQVICIGWWVMFLRIVPSPCPSVRIFWCPFFEMVWQLTGKSCILVWL